MTQLTSNDTTEDLSEALGEAEVKDFKQKSVTGAVSYMVRSLILYGIGLITSLTLSAYLTVEAFGVFGLVTQLVGLLQLFSDIGLGPILIQQKSEPTKQQYRTVFTVQLGLSLLLFLIVVMISQLGVVQAKIGSSGVWVLLALGISLPLGALKTISANMLERKLAFSKLVIPNIAEQLLYNAIMIVLAVKGYGVSAYAYAVFARSVVGVIAMWLIQPWPIGLAFEKSFIKGMVKMGSGFQASNILAAIKDQIFYLTLGWFLPPQQFGFISWSKSWSQVPYMLTVQNVIAITFPAYARLQHDKDRLKRAIEKTLYFISLTIFPVLVGMAVFIIPLTQVVERYHKWQPTILTFILFTLSIGWAGISTPLTNTLSAVGKVDKTFKLMLMWTLLTWLITPLLLKYVGFNGVALSAFLIAFTSVIPIYFVRQIVPIQVWPQVWRPLLSATVMAMVAFVGIPWWSRSILWLLLGMIISSVTYLGMILLVGFNQLKLEVLSLRNAARAI